MVGELGVCVCLGPDYLPFIPVFGIYVVPEPDFVINYKIRYQETKINYYILPIYTLILLGIEELSRVKFNYTYLDSVFRFTYLSHP